VGYYFREALLIGGEATRLYLVRHAQSQGNTGDDLATGDPPLTDVGWEQARRLGERFASQKVDVVYASPLARSRDTAQSIADAARLPVRIEPGLTEVSLGTPERSARLYQGQAAEELARRIAREGTWDAFPGSEGSRAARRRVGAVIDGIIQKNEGKRVALVTHAGFIQTCVSLVLGLERDFVFYPFNAGITSIRAKGDRRVLWRLNDVAHLDGLPAGWGGIS